MGQYHIVVNLDKMEKIDPRSLGYGKKLLEFISYPNMGSDVGNSLIILLASKSNGQGSGDLPEDPIVGRWCGNRIAFVGDYDDKTIYDTPMGQFSGADIYNSIHFREVADLLKEYMSSAEWKKEHHI